MSDIMIMHPEVNSFEELLVVLGQSAKEHDRVFLEMDLKPEYPDTPRNWEMLVEAAFSFGEK